MHERLESALFCSYYIPKICKHSCEHVNEQIAATFLLQILSITFISGCVYSSAIDTTQE